MSLLMAVTDGVVALLTEAMPAYQVEVSLSPQQDMERLALEDRRLLVSPAGISAPTGTRASLNVTVRVGVSLQAKLEEYTIATARPLLDDVDTVWKSLALRNLFVDGATITWVATDDHRLYVPQYLKESKVFYMGLFASYLCGLRVRYRRTASQPGDSP